MKIILTTGHPFAGYEQAGQLLELAGVQAASPSRREGLLPLEFQGSLVTASGVKNLLSEVPEQLVPGRLWHELAVDLFLANQEKGVWGWSDSHTARLLDFWHSFDQQVYFVLVYNSPEQVVGSMLAESTNVENDIATVVASWSAWHSHLLKFYNRHQDRCILVEGTAVLAKPSEFMELVKTRFGATNLQKAVQNIQRDMHQSAVLSLLVKGLIGRYDEIQSLQLELESSADLTLKSEQQITKMTLDAWNEYRDLKGLCQFEQQKLKDHAEQLTIERTTAAKAAEIAQREAEQQKKESELLLLQLHQVQEELEQTFLENKELQEKSGKQLQQMAEQQKQIEQLGAAKNTIEKQLADYKLAQDQQAQKHRAEIKATADKSKAEIAHLNSKADELARENELLLLQLHQVQEELEHYFILYKESTASQKSAQCQAGEKAVPLEECTIDLRQDIQGDNWYYPEADGRWAGPANNSQLILPALAAGKYKLTLDIVDAMSPEIVQNTRVSLNGKQLSFDKPGFLSRLLKKKPRYPLALTARVVISNSEPSAENQLVFEFPKLVSPAERGADDRRNLAIRLRSVQFVRV